MRTMRTQEAELINMRRQLLGLGVVAASSLFALNAAHAMNAPAAIQIDGGPLGSLQLSGGVEGYGYVMSGAANGQKTDGFNVANALIDLQKNTGLLQFNIEVGSNGGAVTLGTPPVQTSITNLSTGPLYEGYVTIAPKGSPVTVSAGMLASLEGYESGLDWNNPDQITTAIFYVENQQSRGVSANYTKGPVNATVSFGDGYNTGVFNFLQGLFTYTFNSSNVVNVFFGANLGRTGLAAKTYSGTCAYGSTAPGCYGTVYAYGPEAANSDLIGAYYSYTKGNLNLVPEVQYQIAKADAQLGLDKPTSNFGAALFGDYTFGSSPYSLGGWVEYFDSHGSAAEANANLSSWFVGQNAEAVGFSVAPTWQYKYLFARANAGYLYLLNNKASNGATYGYGNNSTGRSQFLGTIEAGVLF